MSLARLALLSLIATAFITNHLPKDRERKRVDVVSKLRTHATAL